MGWDGMRWEGMGWITAPRDAGGNQEGFSHLESCKPPLRELPGMLRSSTIIPHVFLPPFKMLFQQHLITKPRSLAPHALTGTLKDINCGQNLPRAQILQRRNVSTCKMKRRNGCSLFLRKGQVTVGDTQRVICASLNLSAGKEDVLEIINIYLCL